MARQTSFGDTLRMARERKGIDLASAARKLRIRPDILRAIEDGDFARMPPRGYTSNMVGAYARLVGVNPTEATRAYRDEAYQFETGRRPVSSRSERGRLSDREDDFAGSRRSSSRASRDAGLASSRVRGGRPSRSEERSRRAAASQPQYTNLVQGRQAPGFAANFGSMLPLIGIGALILILLIVVLFFAFGGNKTAPAEDTPTIHISGMPSPAGTETGSTSGDAADTATPAVQPVAPTSAKFTYKVADGKSVYIEISMDGKTKKADTVTGPDEGSYDVTDTLKFVVSGDLADVEIAVDGKTVEPTVTKSGVYSYTVDFDEVLEEWRRDNGVGGGTDDGAASSKDGDDSSKDSSSDDGDAEDPSSSSDN
ncbi:helix-turn-helix domain-containing protein [Adlercreutzia sp. R7]|uniref:Helix-turn-helix domain-containing protein n=1 Tax=Adlercreutzia wanghongyangiae TaxID=3111451 RepID=A0ABU6IHL1_9ACTN|nr:helix-turn-helix domain-containing protein [Adlercreutzia sp. R7]